MIDIQVRDAISRLNALILALRNTRCESDMVLLRREIRRECAACPRAYEKLQCEIDGLLPAE